MWEVTAEDLHTSLHYITCVWPYYWYNLPQMSYVYTSDICSVTGGERRVMRTSFVRPPLPHVRFAQLFPIMSCEFIMFEIGIVFFDRKS